MTTHANTLILDFGGVISRTLFETHHLTESALSLTPGTLQWRGPFAPETDAYWQQMQNGEISERDYWMLRTKEVGALVGENWQNMSDFVKRARGDNPQEVIRPETLQLINNSKKAGRKLAILSNELDLFYGVDFRKKLDFLTDFNVITDATYTGILKPDPQAYLRCLEQLGESPESCVFVDDQAKNIRGAKEIGLLTVHFDVTNPRQSCEESAELLGIHF